MYVYVYTLTFNICNIPLRAAATTQKIASSDMSDTFVLEDIRSDIHNFIKFLQYSVWISISEPFILMVKFAACSLYIIFSRL